MAGWIYRPVPRPAADVKLFCWPPAGLGAAVYRLWPKDLSPEVEVCAIELPGRGARLREKPISSVSAILSELLPVLRAELDRPFVFFGHSMGAVLAAETARALAASGEWRLSHLIVSAHRPPGMPDGEPVLHTLDDREFVTEINRRYAGIPQQLLEDKETLSLLLPALRADVAALEQHQPAQHAPLTTSITAFGGTSDGSTPREHLEAWRQQTTASFRARMFTGGHFYLESQRAAVLTEVSQILEAAMTRNKTSSPVNTRLTFGREYST